MAPSQQLASLPVPQSQTVGASTTETALPLTETAAQLTQTASPPVT